MYSTTRYKIIILIKLISILFPMRIWACSELPKLDIENYTERRPGHPDKPQARLESIWGGYFQILGLSIVRTHIDQLSTH